MAARREQILTEVRRRWEVRDSTPLLPWLSGSLPDKAAAGSSKQSRGLHHKRNLLGRTR
jgi:hypothetical protein